MAGIPSVKQVMTPFPFTVESLDDIRVARAKMDQHGIRHLAVMHDGKLAGVLSDRELQVTQAILGAAKRPADIPVWAVCTRDPFVVELDEPLDAVAEEMANRHIGSVLVVREGKPAGIVTTTDLCRVLCETLRGE